MGAHNRRTLSHKKEKATEILVKDEQKLRMKSIFVWDMTPFGPLKVNRISQARN
jgi:hypothetical protein